jgi:orotidine-5'-phosphate decarboxylase
MSGSEMPEIIVALDVATPKRAWEVVEAIPGLRWVKIGPRLFVQDGPALVRGLKQREIRVFLDLKWHDIPTAVGAAAGAAAALGVDLATVHALGGPEMVGAAVAEAGSMRIAAVSVLTSHGADGYWSTVGRAGGPADLTAEVVRLVTLAVAAGARAVVSSPREVAAVKAVAGRDCWIVTPGIRLGGAGVDDHQRAADPAFAAKAGATHLVVGRPVVRAERPGEVYETLVRAVT